MSSSAVSTASGSPRPEMISSAISFLSDPKVQSSSIAQRIAFLESKGLTSAEIDDALRQTGMAGNASAGPSHSPNGQMTQQHPQQQQQYYRPMQSSYYGASGQHPQQPQNGRDWRDWFIMAVVSGAVGYGVIALARKYLFPHLQPPNQTILEADRDALTAKYDEVAATLAQLDAETKGIKAGMDEQKAAVDDEMKKVEEALDEVRRGEKTRKEEMEKISREVDNMKRDIPKMFESSSASTSTSLSELQNELKSLRSLLVSRTAATNGNGAHAGLNGNSSAKSGFSSPRTGNNSPPFGVGQGNAKPAIPAWQLAGSATTDKKVTTKDDGPVGSSAAEAGKEHEHEGREQGGYEV